MTGYDVRPATRRDAETLSALWYRITEECKTWDPRIRLSLNAQDLWQKALHTWLENPEVQVLVADQAGTLIGYAIGWLLERPMFYYQQRYGFISELNVDGHAHIGGVGSALLAGLADWFSRQQIETVEISVMHGHPIAQAFWRAKGAMPYMDHLWLRLPPRGVE
ncbi:MAG: GNAT family N-acetyltransferase [Chloroflexi bacterium]|nr:GNAT family N-acetyltransferase [Chloroflexota bacterium]